MRGGNMKNVEPTKHIVLLVIFVLTCLIAACNIQNKRDAISPTMESPLITDVPTLLSTVTLSSKLAQTSTIPVLSSDAKVLKNIVYSPCIPVEESLSDNIDIPWDLLIMQGGSLYILNLEDETKTVVPYFSERMLVEYYFHVSPNGKWLAYPSRHDSKLIVEPVKSLLTNTNADRIVLEKDRWFDVLRWVDNETVLVIYQKPKEDSFYPTVFLNPFTEEENVFSLEDMPNYMEQKFGGAVYVTHYMNGGELVPDPTLKKLIYPEQGNDGIFNTLWDIENEKPFVMDPKNWTDRIGVG